MNRIRLPLAFFLLAACVQAFAQSYPARAVRVVVPFPAGGPSDVLVRTMAQRMSEGWVQPVIVENKPGANTVIGAETVARSAPDGYTLLMVIDSTLTMNPSLYSKLPYDAIKDFAPITVFGYGGIYLMADRAKGPSSIQELIQFARANPGKLNIGGGAASSSAAGARPAAGRRAGASTPTTGIALRRLAEHVCQPSARYLRTAYRMAEQESPKPARILTAVAPDTIERVRRILLGHDLVIVNDLAHAENAVRRDGLSLVFVGARFDDSRMFDLIELVRNELERKKIPIVAAIITPTTLGKEAIAGLSHAVKIFGASLFISLNDFPDNVVGNARARVIVDTMILPPEAVTRIAPAPLRPA